MHISTLDDLIEIYAEGPPLANFSADHAIDLWLNDSSTTRRPHQTTRKPYKPREKTPCSSSEILNVDEAEEDNSSDENELTLDKWDQWFMSSEDEVSSDYEDP